MKIQIRNQRSKRFLRFAMVGLVGFIINNFILWITYEVIELSLFISSPLAIAVAILNNFILNNFFTWKVNISNRKYSFLQSLWRYYLSASIAGFVNYTILLVLTIQFNFYYLAANITGILAGMMINFLVSEKWTFSSNLYQTEK
ncbi:MAG: GtrA family protein [Calditrichaeota bacterium]|nr:MAG: GtrA family protein [Calditrichota bacterium]MBL1205824.1 GtrA family protein [Calditrichota bacterium]NOG45651.1 GtrA family protein [Calditrichota bacterium]